MKKLIISSVAVLCLTGMVFGATPLLHYQFEADLTDSAGTNDGTWYGGDGSGNTFAPGPFGNALYIDGSSGGVAATGVFGDMAGKTMVAWIRIDSDAGSMHFFSSAGGGSRFYVSRVAWGGETGFTLAANTGPTDEWFGLVDYVVGDWAHIAISVSNDASPVSTMYVNGIAGDPATSTDSGVYIDGLNLASYGSYAGAIDDFAILDGVIDATEAGLIMDYGVTGPRTGTRTPDPEDDAIDVPVDKTLGWGAPGETSGTDPVTYEVYYSTADGNDLGPAHIPANGGEDTFLDPDADFAHDTKYYWRVDVTDPNTGGTPVTHTGDRWNFTTVPTRVIALNPTPDGTTVDPSVTLIWDSDINAAANEVYLRQPDGFDNAWYLIKTLTTSGPGTSYTPSDDVEIRWDERYEWRIDTVFEDEILGGDVWTFDTTTPVCNGGERLPGDETGDCLVTLADLAVAASNWLVCGWEPEAACGVWPYSDSTIITTHMEVWIRDVSPDRTFEGDFGGVYNPARGDIRTTLVEFDLSALEGKTLIGARMYAWNLSAETGNADPCKSHAFIIDPNATPASSSTWNTYQAEYAGTEVLLDLGAFDVPAGAPSAYFGSTFATPEDLALIEAETIANGGDGILTLVLIADDDPTAYRFDIGDDTTRGSGNRMYLEFLTE